MSDSDPPRTDWLDLAVMSRDDEDYQDEWGTILDEENFERLDQEVPLAGTHADRPAEAPFDGAKYHATDVNAVFSWDASASEWIVLNSGKAEEPLPGTSHHEAVRSDAVYSADPRENVHDEIGGRLDFDGACIALHPHESYTITDPPLRIDSDGVSIIGPRSATIRVGDDLIDSNSGPNELEINGRDGLLQGWTFDGNAPGQDAEDVYGIQFSEGASGWTVSDHHNYRAVGDAYGVFDDDLRFNNVYARDFTEDGIHYRASNLQVSNSTFKGSYPLKMQGSGGVRPSGARFTNCQFVAEDSRSVLIRGINGYDVSDVWFSNCRIVGDRDRALDVQAIGADVRDLQFDACRFDRTGGTGAAAVRLYADGNAVQDVRFCGGVIDAEDAENYCVYPQGTSGGTVQRVVFEDVSFACDDSAILESDSQDITVRDWVVRNPTVLHDYRGFYFQTADNIVVEDVAVDQPLRRAAVDVRSGVSNAQIRGFVQDDVDNEAVDTKFDGVVGGGPLGGVDLTKVSGSRDGDVAVSDGSSSEFPRFTEARWDAADARWVRVDGEATISPE